MTTRNFDALFAPAAIALIGASRRPGSVGDVLAANLLAGGFKGELMFLHPEGGQVRGREASGSVAALPRVPDLAVIATPAASVPGLVAELGARGCRAAVVISAGFEGDDPESAARRKALLDAAKPHLLRIVGPNCLGLLSPAQGVNASFARTMPPAGSIALVAQSGAVAAAALDWAPAHGLGFSHVVTLGNSLDADVGDLLDFLGRDPATDAVLLYVESLRDARKFMSAARAAARAKPVLVLKGGRSPAGAKAAFSHTRALAGADAVYAAAFRRAGLLQVDGLDALFDTALAVAGAHGAAPATLSILTNGGGAGVLAADALAAADGRLTTLSPTTQAALAALLPASAASANPVDILGDAAPRLYGAALGSLLDAPEVEAVLAINCPTAVADSGEAAEAVIAAARDRAKPVLAAWLGEASVAEGRRRLNAAGVATYGSPEAAVRAFAALREARGLHDQLLQAPDGEDGEVHADRARAVVAGALAAGRDALGPSETHAVLRAYGVPILETRTVATPAEAGAVADALGGPVALKILSPQISHKSDVGGVIVGLQGREAVTAAADAMRARVRAARPDAQLEGFIVQPRLTRPKAQEVLAGLVRDPTFGPVVVVGHGGVAVEVLADRALALPPLNLALARDQIARTRVSRLLAGYRDRPPADLDALARILIALGRLATDIPEIAELDLNPLLCDDAGALALDARIAVRQADEGARPAILPYPSHLRRTAMVGGEALVMRPIRPTDAPALIAMIDRCTPEDRRLRFCSGMLHLNPALANQLCQIDYDRHMALVLETAAGEILGVGRLVEDPQGEGGEFALVVRSDRQNQRLGRMLLQAVLDYGRARGLTEVWGDVAADNPRMLGMTRAFGFTSAPSEADLGRVRVSRRL
jgi:acetyltransferase